MKASFAVTVYSILYMGIAILMQPVRNFTPHIVRNTCVAEKQVATTDEPKGEILHSELLFR